MFWIKNKKIRNTPANPSFAIQKWGLRGYSLHGQVFLMLPNSSCKRVIRRHQDVLYDFSIEYFNDTDTLAIVAMNTVSV